MHFAWTLPQQRANPSSYFFRRIHIGAWQTPVRTFRDGLWRSICFTFGRREGIEGGSVPAQEASASTQLSDSQRARRGTRQTRSGSQRVHGTGRQMNCDCLLIAWSPNSAGASSHQISRLSSRQRWRRRVDLDWQKRRSCVATNPRSGRVLADASTARDQKKKINTLSFT